MCVCVCVCVCVWVCVYVFMCVCVCGEIKYHFETTINIVLFDIIGKSLQDEEQLLTCSVPLTSTLIYFLRNDLCKIPLLDSIMKQHHMFCAECLHKNQFVKN